MESPINPYTSPSANLFGSSGQTSNEAVPAEAIIQLQQTKPWVRFFSVMMWIAVFFMLLAGLGMAALSMIGGEAAKAAGMPPTMAIILGGVYAVFAFLYIYPAMKIWQYASSIQRLVNSRHPSDLVSALSHQRAFWKFVGILMILVILAYVLIFVVAIGAGVAAGMKGMPSP